MKKSAPLISALQNTQYAKFITARDKALERLLYVAQRRQTIIMRHVLFELLSSLKKQLDHRMSVKAIETLVRHHMHQAALLLTAEVIRIKRQAFVLAGVGEAEALARMAGNARYDFSSNVINFKTQDAKTPAFIEHYCSKLATKITQAAYMSHVLNEETPIETIEAVVKILPAVKRVKKPKETLPRQLEATKAKAPDNLALGQVDDREWQQIVSDYDDATLPDTRGPEDAIDKRTLPKEYEIAPDEQIYAWDVEKQMTEDFVASVRAGQIEAANQNGIDDFVWIAILDKRTDECCEWRDGLLTSEIEYELSAGDHQGDECDAIVPPAHFNCRCRLAPAVAQAFEDVKSNAGEFIDWLNAT